MAIVVVARVCVNSHCLEHDVQVRVRNFKPDHISRAHLDVTHYRVIRGAPMVLPVLRSRSDERNGQSGNKGRVCTVEVGYCSPGTKYLVYYYQVLTASNHAYKKKQGSYCSWYVFVRWEENSCWDNQILPTKHTLRSRSLFPMDEIRILGFDGTTPVSKSPEGSRANR